MSVPVGLGIITSACVLAAPIMGVAAAASQKEQLLTATDSAALAAADALTGLVEDDSVAQNPCLWAERVLDRNGVKLESCRVFEEELSVRVTASTASIFGRIYGSSRAGASLEKGL